MDSKTVTPLLILLPVLFGYYLFKVFVGPWTSFSTFFILIMFFFTIIMLFIERIIIKDVSKIKIWILEISLIITIMLGYIFYNSKLYYIVEKDTKWFVVVDSNKSDIELNTSFLFDKSVYIKNKDIIYLNRNDIGKRKPFIKANSDSIIYSCIEYVNNNGEKYTIFIIYPYSLNLNDEIYIFNAMKKNF